MRGAQPGFRWISRSPSFAKAQSKSNNKVIPVTGHNTLCRNGVTLCNTWLEKFNPWVVQMLRLKKHICTDKRMDGLWNWGYLVPWYIYIHVHTYIWYVIIFISNPRNQAISVCNVRTWLDVCVLMCTYSETNGFGRCWYKYRILYAFNMIVSVYYHYTFRQCCYIMEVSYLVIIEDSGKITWTPLWYLPVIYMVLPISAVDTWALDVDYSLVWFERCVFNISTVSRNTF